MRRLIRIVQAHMDQYGVSEAEVARRIGTTPQTVNTWRNSDMKQLPRQDYLRALADLTQTDYPTVLAAALTDTGYLVDPAGLDANHAAVLAALAVDADDLKAAAADVDTGVDLDDQATVANLLAAVDNLVAEADAVAEAIHAAAVALVAGDEAALRQLKRTIRRYRRENADPRRLDISFTRGSDQAWSDTASDRSSSAGSSAVPDP